MEEIEQARKAGYLTTQGNNRAASNARNAWFTECTRNSQPFVVVTEQGTLGAAEMDLVCTPEDLTDAQKSEIEDIMRQACTTKKSAYNAGSIYCRVENIPITDAHLVAQDFLVLGREASVNAPKVETAG